MQQGTGEIELSFYQANDRFAKRTWRVEQICSTYKRIEISKNNSVKAFNIIA
jgi:hypothetical protein